MDNAAEQLKPPIADWVHPPNTVEVISLWDILHDAKLISAQLDWPERTLKLEFDIWHVRKFHRFPDEARFILRLKDINSLRIVGNETAFETSIAFAEFAEKLEAENGGTDTFEADFMQIPGSVALRLFLHVNDEFYPEFIVRAESLDIFLSTGEKLTLQEFLHLGEAYWEDFAGRSNERSESQLS